VPALKPDETPRYPPTDLTLIGLRIRERRAYVGPAREAVDADTDMMETLLREVHNLRLANAALKDVIDAMQRYRGRK
jgi:hypothetical protein